MAVEESSAQAKPEPLAALARLTEAVEAGEVDLLREPLAPMIASYQELAMADLELASAFLLGAARLVERKAKLAAPSRQEEPVQGDAEDEAVAEEAALALAERLAELRVFSEAVEALRAFEEQAWGRVGRPAPLRLEPPLTEGEGPLDALYQAFQRVWERAERATREVTRERVTVRQRMADIVRLLQEGPREFLQLFDGQVSRRDVVITFLALLELIRLGRVRARQDGPFARLVIVPEAPAVEGEPL